MMSLVPGYQNGQKENSTREVPEARENASDQVVIGFHFAFDWLQG